MITYREYFAATRRMRQLQRAYYDGGRKREDLIAAKDAERQVDKLIQSIESRRPLEEGGGVQSEMFPTQGGRS
jgi:hypothetical protein